MPESKADKQQCLLKMIQAINAKLEPLSLSVRYAILLLSVHVHLVMSFINKISSHIACFDVSVTTTTKELTVRIAA